MSCAAGLLSLLRRGRWGAGETDLEAERVKLPHEPIGLALGVTATLEVIGAEVNEEHYARIFDESTRGLATRLISCQYGYILNRPPTVVVAAHQDEDGEMQKSTARFGILVGVEKC